MITMGLTRLMPPYMNAPIKGKHSITSIKTAIVHLMPPLTKIIANATENHCQLITLLVTAAYHLQLITLVTIKALRITLTQAISAARRVVILPIQVIQDKKVSPHLKGVNHSKDTLT